MSLVGFDIDEIMGRSQSKQKPKADDVHRASRPLFFAVRGSNPSSKHTPPEDTAQSGPVIAGNLQSEPSTNIARVVAAAPEERKTSVIDRLAAQKGFPSSKQTLSPPMLRSSTTRKKWEEAKQWQTLRKSGFER